MADKPIHQDPVTLVQKTAAKNAAKADRQATRILFQNLLATLMVLHFVGVIITQGGGVAGYWHHLVSIWRLIVEAPYLGPVIFFALVMMYHGVHEWRHRADVPLKRLLPPYPPLPDLRFSNDIYIGSAWTREGKQPGEIIGPDEEVLEPHQVLVEKGLFGNVHVKGAVGGGKTASFINPVLDQIIGKFPKPYPPTSFTLGKDGRYQAVPMTGVARDSLLANEDVSLKDPQARELWNPYVGMTPPEADAEYARLVEQHEHRKWGGFVIDAKGDITQHVLRSAKAWGRERDVVVLSMKGPYTYNPLIVSGNALVMAEMIMDGIEAVTGENIPGYYRQTGSEWMGNALTILKTVNPAKVTMKTLLTMAQDEQMRTRWVGQAFAKMKEVEAEEERVRRFGREYTGMRVNPAALEFFKAWDDPEADAKQKQAIISGIKAQAKFFVDDETSRFLCPDLPPTFKGFDRMIEHGQIVVLRVPLSEYANVGRVLGILLMADAQQAILDRVLKPQMNQERVVALVVDECAAYLNRLTKDFLSRNRQSRAACFFAHQTSAQLMHESDRGTENAYNDNMRTKVSFSSPNAEAGRKEAALFGSRKTEKMVYSEGSNFTGVERLPGNENLAVGGESRSASVRMEEVERLWFTSEDFTSLELGQCIVSEFDGITTRPPRKILAPLLHKTSRGRYLETLEVTLPADKPHPYLVLGTVSGDEDYLDSALSNTGFIICHTLKDRAGEVQGIKFVSEQGTVIVPSHLLATRVYDLVGQRLSDSHAVTVLVDGTETARLLKAECGVRFDRILSLPEGLRYAPPDEPALWTGLVSTDGDLASLGALVKALSGQDMPYPVIAGWEEHTSGDEEQTDAMIRFSRTLLGLYARVAHHLAERMGEDGFEDLTEHFRAELEAALNARPLAQQEEPAGESADAPAEAPADPPAVPDRSVLDGPPAQPARPKKKRSRRNKPAEDHPSLFVELSDIIEPSPLDATQQKPDHGSDKGTINPPVSPDLPADESGTGRDGAADEAAADDFHGLSFEGEEPLGPTDEDWPDPETDDPDTW